jgi:hypothetical protein
MAKPSPPEWVQCSRCRHILLLKDKAIPTRRPKPRAAKPRAALAAALRILARVVEGDPRWTSQRPPTDARAALVLVTRALEARDATVTHERGA